MAVPFYTNRQQKAVTNKESLLVRHKMKFPITQERYWNWKHKVLEKRDKILGIKYLARYTHSFILAWYSTELWYCGVYSFLGFLFMFWHRFYRCLDWQGMGKKDQRSRPIGSIPLIVRYYGYGPAIAEIELENKGKNE